MNILNPNDFITKRRIAGKKLLTMSNNKLSMSIETAKYFHEQFQQIDEKTFCAFELGMDDTQQLSIRPSTNDCLTAMVFRLNNKRFEYGNTNLSKHLKKLHPTNSEKETVHFLISDAVNEEGWYPVITNYK